MLKVRKPSTFKITSEARAMIDLDKQITLELLKEMDKPGVNRNVSYLRQSITREFKQPQPPQQPTSNLRTPSRQDQGQQQGKNN